MNRIKILILYSFLLISARIESQTIDSLKLNAYFDTLAKYNKFMGTVAISKDGKMLYTKSVGYLNVDKELKANENSKYRIGSISKTFTAVLVLKAVEKNLLSLDDTIVKFFPSLPNANRITIRHLLQHRSGIRNFTNDSNYYKWFRNTVSEKQLVEIISAGGSEFEPNQKAQYSNSNYVLLSYILLKVHQKSFASILSDEITFPLELKHTRVGIKINNDLKEASSYVYKGLWVEQPETDMSVPMGAGNIISRPRDMVEFATKLFEGKVLNPSSLEEMKTIVDGYGLGILSLPYGEKRGFGHAGGIDGFSSIFAYFPEDKLSYALMSNGNNYDVNFISMVVLGAFYQKPFDIPSFTTFNILESELEKYAGVYRNIKTGLVVTIFKENNMLMAQATGQQAFPLEPASKDVFKVDLVGLELSFKPKENSMHLKQGKVDMDLIRPSRK